jgi:predicted HTH domain antitoxin
MFSIIIQSSLIGSPLQSGGGFAEEIFLMWQSQDRSVIHISHFRRWHGSGVAAALYREGKITMRDAAAIIGVPVRTALWELGERGIYIRYGMEELEEDVK